MMGDADLKESATWLSLVLTIVIAVENTYVAPQMQFNWPMLELNSFVKSKQKRLPFPIPI